MKFLKYGIALLSFLNIMSIQAQLLTVKSSFSEDSIMIGEQLMFSLTAEVDEGVQLNFPVFSENINAEIEILEAYDQDTSVNEEGKIILKKDFLVTSFSPGWNTVAPLEISFRKNETSDTIYTAACLLTVLSPTIDTTQAIMPIKPPMNTPVSFAEVWPITLLVIALLTVLGLIAYLIWRWVQKKRNPEFFETEKLEPAHVVALRDLENLREAKLPQKGMIKEFYTKLTDIVRQYITRSYGISAMESTTYEIMQQFKQLEDSNELNEKLEELLMLADLVKFAKEDPLMSENDLNLDNATQFVKDTCHACEENEMKGEKDD